MNTSFTLSEITLEAGGPELASITHDFDTSIPARQQESRRMSRAELAQKVLKLTGSVRLASRSAHHWHHCGINE